MNSRLASCLFVCIVCLGVSTAFGGEEEARSGVSVYPLQGQALHVVSNGVIGGVAGAVTEKLAYDNPLGSLAAELPAGIIVADDMKLDVLDGCALRRYRFQIVGKAHDRACGPVGTPCGPLTVRYWLFEECPGAGGAQIAGTEGCASSDPARPDCIPIDSEALTEIHVTVPAGETIPLPSRVWLGVAMSRPGAGVVVGAPALKGFSDDVLDTSNFPCNSTVGGFPRFPHSSFNASVYVDPACADTSLTYQNIRASAAGFNAGPDACMADDLTLNRACDMIEMEVGVRNRGRYDVELRQSFNSQPLGPCNGRNDIGTTYGIPGTSKVFLVSSDGLAVRRFTFDPPVPLPSDKLFAVMSISTIGGQWIMTRRNASVGDTWANFWAFVDGQWVTRIPSDNSHGAMHFSITCAGEAPIGACCDQYVRDENDEAVCRDVAEINCPLYPKGAEVEPAWAEGVPCRVCACGERDSLPCQSDADCGGGVCVDNDPFLLPCGQSACCTPKVGCLNLTKNECDALRPVGTAHEWHVGQYCNQGGYTCPRPAVLYCGNATGDCYAPGEKVCQGGPDVGSACSSDSDCRGDNDAVCANLGRWCVGGDYEGQPCIRSLDCGSPGWCPYEPFGACKGGPRDGLECHDAQECMEAPCLASNCCGDTGCANDVCTADDYCCWTSWDQYCADLALLICEPECPAGTISAIDPPSGVIDAGIPRDCASGAPLGIDTLTFSAPPGAPRACWRLEELATIGGPNGIAEVVEAPAGTYTVTLGRPITPGACTSIVYDRDGPNEQSLTFTSHPGDVGADGMSSAADVLDLIDIFNGAPAPFGEYSSDVNRSGVTNAADVLALIDLLNGSGCFNAWNNVAFPGCGDCPEP